MADHTTPTPEVKPESDQERCEHDTAYRRACLRIASANREVQRMRRDLEDAKALLLEAEAELRRLLGV